MARLEQQLTQMLTPAVEALGFSLLGVEMVRAGRSATLRLYIDGPEGVTVDNCAEVSHQVSSVLDVEDPIQSEYFLEVSSPGLDRPLFVPAHFEKVVGSDIEIKLVVPVAGRRRFKGKLVAIEGDLILLAYEGKEDRFAFSNIDKANLVPQF
ncbi:ribosome maturation factor RimP [Gallaecimonas mangrovi]|uniref:ribosome maturation factor RimP n=1 Tax=Gallaecimonas mangrovi TaxID=2291597 RepID=UPI000E2013BD|nr:ribosome maturation factor RimP [Gallaecimonas mangrovi]